MTLLAQYFDALSATFKRDALVFLTYRWRLFSHIATIFFSLTMFYFLSRLVRQNAVGSHAHYYAFAVVGIVGASVLTSALNIAISVRGELMAGTFERMLISAFGPVGCVISEAVFPIFLSLVTASLMLLFASTIYGVPVHLAGIPAALGVSALGALALTCIGLMFVAGVFMFKSSMGVAWVVGALALLGGAYFPVKLFPAWIEWVSQVQPFTPAVDLLRHSLLGTTTMEPAWLELAKLVGFTVVLMPVSAALMWYAIHASRRRGTLLEY